jgi:hypothetical protein
MKKNICINLLALIVLMQFAFAETVIKDHVTSVVEVSNASSISIYNTGLTMNIEDSDGFGANFRGAVDGPVDQIDSKDFNLGKFVKELNAKYKIKTEEGVILLSVGKMTNGAKTDVGNPSKLGGVMGIRLSIEPEKLPAIQEWLNQNQFKIDRIDITRYNAESANRLDITDLNNTNMTSLAVYLSRSNNFQTFFVYKTPDSDNPFGVTSKTVGAVYIMGGKLKPQLFAMKHVSDAAFMDLDLLVLSADLEILPNFTNTFTYARAKEFMSNTDVENYDFSMTRVLTKTKDYTLSTTFGIKFDYGTTQDKIIYFRLEAKF